MKRIKPSPEKVQHIIDMIVDATGVSRAVMFSKDRHNSVVVARFMLYYVLYHHCNFTYKEIGSLFNANHAGIMYGVSSAFDWLTSHDVKDKVICDRGKTLRKIILKLK